MRALCFIALALVLCRCGDPGTKRNVQSDGRMAIDPASDVGFSPTNLTVTGDLCARKQYVITLWEAKTEGFSQGHALEIAIHGGVPTAGKKYQLADPGNEESSNTIVGPIGTSGFIALHFGNASSDGGAIAAGEPIRVASIVFDAVATVLGAKMSATYAVTFTSGKFLRGSFSGALKTPSGAECVPR